MKHFIGKFLAGAIMPFALILALYPTNIGTSYGASLSTLQRHFSITEIDEAGNKINTFEGTSGELDPFLVTEQLGAKPFVEDKFTVNPDLSERFGSQIILYRAPVYTIKDGKKLITIRSWQTMVGGLIDESDIPEIGVDDKINFALDEKLDLSMQVVIIRVAKTTVIEKEAIVFKTVKKENPKVEKGNKKTLQTGKKGLKQNYFLVTREDGVQVSKNFIKSEVVDEPMEEILEIGTKIVVLDTGKATWYTRTSELIAAHNSIKRGTKVRVVNLSNGKSVVVTIVGGGIFHSDNVVIDLSTGAFEALGSTLETGKLNSVRIEKYYPED